MIVISGMIAGCLIVIVSTTGHGWPSHAEQKYFQRFGGIAPAWQWVIIKPIRIIADGLAVDLLCTGTVWMAYPDRPWTGGGCGLVCD